MGLLCKEAGIFLRGFLDDKMNDDCVYKGTLNNNCLQNACSVSAPLVKAGPVNDGGAQCLSAYYVAAIIPDTSPEFSYLICVIILCDNCL